ncbi:hypothetical protein [Nocardia asteroides]|nr:hypothetical protein [Nocardia asteroides]UGT55172.1 hypothetical protein LTT85_32080 [Nocardia asteroides]
MPTLDDVVHHGTITVQDCVEPFATKKVTAVAIVADAPERTVDCLDKG